MRKALRKKISPADKNLIKRYLLWCYKTTKEELDRIDRKFTQLEVDYFIRQKLSESKSAAVRLSGKEYLALLADFDDYISKKEKDATNLKYADSVKPLFNPQYVYLNDRLKAIEKAAVVFLGKKELSAMQSLYEGEMTKRILEERQHT